MADDQDEIYDGEDTPDEPLEPPVREESPDAALPSGGLYLGSLIALALATIVGVILFISPPEERSSPSSAPVGGGEGPVTQTTATPTPTRLELTPTVIVTPTPGEEDGDDETATPEETTTTTPQAEETDTYTVTSGDTLSSIAAEFDTTIEELIELNPGIDPDNLTLGQELSVPADR